PALRPDRQLERVAGRPLPDLGGVHRVPVRPLARRQQVEDGAPGRSSAAGRRRRPPRLDVPAALGMGAHAERVDHRGGARRGPAHVRSDRKAARANPTQVASPTGRPPISYASGIIDSASIARMAPAANDWIRPTQKVGAVSSSPDPRAAARPLTIMTSTQVPMIRRRDTPESERSSDADRASGTFETNTATRTGTPMPAPPISESPSTTDSGIPSSTAPSTTARPLERDARRAPDRAEAADVSD